MKCNQQSNYLQNDRQNHVKLNLLFDQIKLKTNMNMKMNTNINEVPLSVYLTCLVICYFIFCVPQLDSSQLIEIVLNLSLIINWAVNHFQLSEINSWQPNCWKIRQIYLNLNSVNIQIIIDSHLENSKWTMNKESSESVGTSNQIAFNQSKQLHYLKQQVNQQNDKIEDAQREIATMRTVLCDARQRLERMKRRN